MSAYLKKLKDPRWQKKRLIILERDQWTCQKCYNSQSTLNVHHLCYLASKDPWDYPDEYLLTLCENCHEYEKDNVSNACDDLIMVIKQAGFLSDDISTITEGFINMDNFHVRDVKAAVVKFFLAKLDTRSSLLYFESLHVDNPGD